MISVRRLICATMFLFFSYTNILFHSSWAVFFSHAKDVGVYFRIVTILEITFSKYCFKVGKTSSDFFPIFLSFLHNFLFLSPPATIAMRNCQCNRIINKSKSQYMGTLRLKILHKLTCSHVHCSENKITATIYFNKNTTQTTRPDHSRALLNQCKDRSDR